LANAKFACTGKHINKKKHELGQAGIQLLTNLLVALLLVLTPTPPKQVHLLAKSCQLCRFFLMICPLMSLPQSINFIPKKLRKTAEKNLARESTGRA